MAAHHAGAAGPAAQDPGAADTAAADITDTIDAHLQTVAAVGGIERTTEKEPGAEAAAEARAKDPSASSTAITTTAADTTRAGGR